MAPGTPKGSRERVLVSPRDMQLTRCQTTASHYELSPPPGDAVSALAFAPVSPTKLLVSSWDSKVYRYDVASTSGENLTDTYEHRAPVLHVCYGADDNEAFFGSMDWGVYR